MIECIEAIICGMRTRDIIALSAVSKRYLHKCLTCTNRGIGATYETVSDPGGMLRWSHLALNVNLESHWDIPCIYNIAKSLTMCGPDFAHMVIAATMDRVHISFVYEPCNFNTLMNVREVSMLHVSSTIRTAHFARMEILKLHSCSHVILGHMPALQELYMSNCDNVTHLHSMRNMRRISATHMFGLQCVHDIENVDHMSIQPAPAFLIRVRKIKKLTLATNGDLDMGGVRDVAHLAVYDARYMYNVDLMANGIKRITIGTTSRCTENEMSRMIRDSPLNCKYMVRRYAPRFNPMVKTGSMFIENCDNIDPHMLKCMQVRHVRVCNSAIVSAFALRNIQKVELFECFALEDICPLAHVAHISMYRCPRVKDLSPLIAVKSLYLNQCHAVAHIPRFAQLEHLVVKECDALVSYNSDVTYTTIVRCARIEGRLFTTSRHVWVEGHRRSRVLTSLE